MTKKVFNLNNAISHSVRLVKPQGVKIKKVIPVADSKDLAKNHHVEICNNMERATLIVIA
jgi:hypothetical protein